VLIRLLRTYLVPFRATLAVVVVLQAVQAICNLLLPTLNAAIIDNGVVNADTGYIWRTGGLMLTVAAIQVTFAIWATYYGAKAAMGFGRDVREALFTRVMSYSAREVATFGAPSLITRITNDVQQVQVLVVMMCTLLVAAPITIVAGVFMAIREDGSLSLILLVSVPFLVIGIGSVIARMVPVFQLVQERIDRINQVLREQITGIRVVRAFVRERHEAARFEVGNVALTDVSLRAGRLMAYMFPIVMITLNLSTVAVVWFGGNLVDDGQLQVGALIAFISYLIQILMSVMMGSFVAVMWPRASVCAERIQEVLTTESSVVPPASPVTDAPATGRLELRDVTFRYPGAEEPVLCNIDLVAEPGQTVAIIGSTGAGKTTLLGLIPRLFDATEGTVFVDGVDVRELDPVLLARRIGLVPQKPYLFSGTVASNLRHGDPSADDDALWDALAVAQARDFVEAMPDGLNSRIEQGGTNVSGGQRQRLAIARALVHKPSIYLFDDSFSALDVATDARLRAALAPVTRDATVVIVAQRVSTIIDADCILVLDDGRIVGRGTHQELLETCPTYAEIVASQHHEEEVA